MSDSILAIVQPSLPRRLFGTGVLGAIGVLLIYIAAAKMPMPIWQVLLTALGAGTLYLSLRMRRATAHRIELTAEGLRCSDGRVIARMDQITGVDRGAFAFKPSNGFLLRLSEPGPRAWAPGLWWRLGHRVGVGGVTSAAQTRIMAEMIEARLAGVDI